jgi:AraC-like DNA-binding protein
MQPLELLQFTGKNLASHRITDFQDVNAFALPSRFGQLENQIHPLNDGRLLRLRHYQCPTEVEFTTHSQPGFHVYIVDQSSVIEHKAQKHQQTFHSQYMHLILEREYTHYRFQASTMASTAISLTSEALAKVQEMTQVSLDKQLQGFLKGGTDFLPRMQYLPLPPPVRQLIRDIQNPPYEDPFLKQMYLEAKTQEWLVYILAELNQSKTGKLPHHALSHTDRLRMFEVEEYLLAHLSHPPSLSLLASKMNTHEKKLNQQFKQVFGQTVFVWLREQRLQTALQLLEQGEKSIQQIAQYCGYKYQSDFCKAFKQRFKVTPSSV